MAQAKTKFRKLTEGVAKFLHTNCIATYPKLFVEYLGNLTYSCIVRNTKAKTATFTPAGNGWAGPTTGKSSMWTTVSLSV